MGRILQIIAGGLIIAGSYGLGHVKTAIDQVMSGVFGATNGAVQSPVDYGELIRAFQPILFYIGVAVVGYSTIMLIYGIIQRYRKRKRKQRERQQMRRQARPAMEQALGDLGYQEQPQERQQYPDDQDYPERQEPSSYPEGRDRPAQRQPRRGRYHEESSYDSERPHRIPPNMSRDDVMRQRPSPRDSIEDTDYSRERDRPRTPQTEDDYTREEPDPFQDDYDSEDDWEERRVGERKRRRDDRDRR